MTERRGWRRRRRQESERFDRSDAGFEAPAEEPGDSSEVSLAELLGDLPGTAEQGPGPAAAEPEREPEAESSGQLRPPSRDPREPWIAATSGMRPGPEDEEPPRPDAAVPDEPGLQPTTAAEPVADESAALAAEVLAQLHAERAEPPPQLGEMAEVPEPMEAREAAEGMDARAAVGAHDPWSAVESVFERPSPAPAAPPRRPLRPVDDDGGDDLQLEWERPEVFDEPAQDEVLRRLGDLGQTVGAIQRRVEQLGEAVARAAEPGAQAAAAFKRLELLERGVEELRLQQERTGIRTTQTVSGIGDAIGDLRAALEEPLMDISERIATMEARLAHIEATERLVEQLNLALGSSPFDLVSTEDLDELTSGVTERVRRLSGRVERLEGALDRGLSGIEESRRAAVETAAELRRLHERAEATLKKAAEISQAAESARRAGTEPEKKAPAKRASARRAGEPARDEAATAETESPRRSRKAATSRAKRGETEKAAPKRRPSPSRKSQPKS